MSLFKLQEHVYEVGVKDPDRRIFDCLVHMPQGTTYNAFYIEGETHNALIDCADPEKKQDLLDHLKELKIEHLDYIILLHAEQDHSGAIYDVLQMFPQARIVCTEKVKTLMGVHLHLPEEQVQVIKENEKLDLGSMNLTFYPIPFAHWPDNTMVHLNPQNILFSSDLFGAHYTLTDTVDELSEIQIKAARGYFSEIMMPFRKIIAKHVAKITEINPKIIAPSHGAIWLRPSEIIDQYQHWTNDDVKPFVTIPYLSMHESTKKTVQFFADHLRKRGVEVKIRNLSYKPESLLIETGEMIADLVDAAAVVFAFPTVLGGPHPAIVYAAVTANAMMPKTKFMGMLCSYGWATKATESLNSIIPNFKAVRFEPLLFKGLPLQEDYDRIKKYANDIADVILTPDSGSQGGKMQAKRL